MTRIRATTPDSFQFRPTDSQPVRTQKLELLRTKAAELEDLAARPVQISFLGNTPDDGQLLWRAWADRPLFLDSITAESDDAADAEATYELKIDGTTIATIVWPAAGTTAECTVITPDISTDSLLKLFAADPADATLANGTIILTFSEAA